MGKPLEKESKASEGCEAINLSWLFMIRSNISYDKFDQYQSWTGRINLLRMLLNKIFDHEPISLKFWLLENVVPIHSSKSIDQNPIHQKFWLAKHFIIGRWALYQTNQTKPNLPCETFCYWEMRIFDELNQWMKTNINFGEIGFRGMGISVKLVHYRKLDSYNLYPIQ